MVVNIFTCSRRQALNFSLAEPWAAISVSTHGDFPELDTRERVGLLRLQFWDISNPTGKMFEAEDPKLFSNDQAKQIWEFVNEIWDKAEYLLVHCEAGLSRSPAIAAAISHVKFGPESVKEWFEKYNLNCFVYKMMLEAHYGRTIADMYADKFKAKEEILEEPWDCKG